MKNNRKFLSNFLVHKGGNSLDNASPGPVKDFVAEHGGHTVITSVLIANNGIAAVKEIRSIRKWAYETFNNERAIQFTVMATPEDLKINADYIKMAEQYVEIPGGSNNNNYANVELIVDVAERMGVHAVWAGWGHASENPRLPEMLSQSKNKIVFIGPSASVIKSLGDKISSIIIAQSANIPCMPWTGSNTNKIKIDSKSGTVSIEDSVYCEACVNTPEEGLEKALAIGFPVIIKASKGGGGKGIRKVEDKSYFKSSFLQVAAEVPGSPIFIMKLAENARHLEVQILADHYGNIISLFGRDCSVQRRHQKIIEEAPVTIAKPDTLSAMEKAAITLGEIVGYVSAGTVEYLYSHADDKFYFLELNPRLQVEHPTTEMITGVNLPAAQLQIAMGLSLHRIKDIRLFYGLDPRTVTEIDFNFSNSKSLKTQRRPQPKGHTTACRITSEDPGEDFKPSSGMMHELIFRSSSNVWGYFSVGAPGGIHSYSDSQFGHIFAFGENRAASRKHMVIALKELSIRGDFRTTVEYLIKLLETQDFEQNTITTGTLKDEIIFIFSLSSEWLDTLILRKLTPERPDKMIAVVCGAIIKAYTINKERNLEYKTCLEKGQILSRETLKTVFAIDFIYEKEKFKFTVTHSSINSYNLFINGSKCVTETRRLSGGGLLILLGGKSHTVYWSDNKTSTTMSINGKTCILEQENDPTQLRSPSPGKLVKYLIGNGEHIKKGQIFAEIEVMKMYLSLTALEDGIVQLIKQPGATLETGDILGILTMDDPSRIKHAKPFEGLLPSWGLPQVIGNKPPQKFNQLMGILKSILQGYENQMLIAPTLKELMNVLKDPELPYGEWHFQFSALSSNIPTKLGAQLVNIVENAYSNRKKFPGKKILQKFEVFIKENALSDDIEILKMKLNNLFQISLRYKDGIKVHKYSVLSNLLEEYWKIESLFDSQNLREEDIILRLRDENKDNLDKVLEIVLSHSKVSSKNDLICAILDIIKTCPSNDISKYIGSSLRKLIDLESKNTIKVSLKAREILIQCSLPSFNERISQMKHILQSSIIEIDSNSNKWRYRTPSLDILRELIDSNYVVFDVLTFFFAHKNPWISLAVLEVYVRRAYRAYSVLNLEYHMDLDVPYMISWKFQSRLSTIQEINKYTPTQLPSVSAEFTENENLEKVTPVTGVPFMIFNSNLPRIGVIVPTETLDQIKDQLLRALSKLSTYNKTSNNYKYEGSEIELSYQSKNSSSKKQFIHVLNILIRNLENLDDKTIIDKLRPIVNDYTLLLLQHKVGRITFVCGCQDESSNPLYYTFKRQENLSDSIENIYTEDKSIRHIEPALAFQLELGRLSNFDIEPVFTRNRNIHIYRATGKEAPGDKRFFIRALVRPGKLTNEIPTSEYLISETDHLIGDILDALEIIGVEYTDLNHIFINFVPNFNLVPDEVEATLGGFIERFGRRLWRLRITSAEIRIICADSLTGLASPLRIIISNVSGFVVCFELYTEVKTEKGDYIFQSIGPPGSMHLRSITTPYATKEWLQPKRYKAHLIGTTYVYDFPEIFRQATRLSWQKYSQTNNNCKIPENILEVKELVMDDKLQFQEIVREPGTNSIGMVAWLITAKTPEYPQGRQFVLIANDITFKMGTFGPDEDQYFLKATLLARQLKIPRIYLSANSGARIGLSEELIPHFSVAWNDPKNPEKGFKYLYLTPEIHQQFKESNREIFISEKIIENGEERFKIVAIIGAEDGLGVECLKGAGLIAGETSRAYEDIFTITLVSCRSVGIGAYLVRLGQRTIQVEGHPIILTGISAINKLLGCEVYSSNLQLGGTQIMYKNGISHLTAKNDLNGISKIMKWLSYIPDKKDNPIPVLSSIDSWDRDVEYIPPKGTYDVRWLIEGKEDEDRFLSGLFDKKTFHETLSGWAKTVVVGRARLGGIPLGIIAVESRSIENTLPADPANPESYEQNIIEAGHVWYPNSAFKTAQAINDFNYGEQLPLFILANWRGFSGGQRDMFNEVLKYGSYIVDSLSKYRQPVFIYIPPYSELRGGSWVVIDPTINEDMMEIYADEESRAGILEPEGVVEIKFRKEKLLLCMSRLDPIYASLKRQLQDPSLSQDQLSQIKTKIEERENLLLPIYRQISIQYADLHDHPIRMKHKGAIRQSLQWAQSRRFFYWRLRRRMSEHYIIQKIRKVDEKLSFRQSIEILKTWIYKLSSNNFNWDNDDREIVLFLEKNEKHIQLLIKEFEQTTISNEIVNMTKHNKASVLNGISRILKEMPDQEANASLKKQAKKNTAAIKKLKIGGLISNSIFISIRLIYRYTSTTKYTFILYFITFSFSMGLSYLLWSMGSPKYKKEHLESPGEDLNQEGIIRYMFYAIYMTWVIHITVAILSDKAWCLYFIPCFVILKHLQSIPRLLLPKKISFQQNQDEFKRYKIDRQKIKYLHSL
ncbi:hypothetical protein PCANB_000328 [Pneumocystis canis]|nr:hypothetical protein PCK1_000391 [Pneumocystis canis]KAG5437982.1 hypothetical protein PCANB_000328 [Pneumocystis canis]